MHYQHAQTDVLLLSLAGKWKGVGHHVTPSFASEAVAHTCAETQQSSGHAHSIRFTASP